MKKCLIVDDEEQNRYLLDKILQGFGYRTTIAENGAEALDKARQDPPDLIITDILMPVMDGYALCRQLKSDDRLKHIPLIFYTATYTEPKDEKFALSLGADRFVLKPQEPDTLMNIIKEVLEENYEVKQVAAKPLGEEMEFFRQHNEILFKKLEKKMLDLETANQKLKCLEEQYRMSFENVADIVWTTDTELIIRKISPSVEKMLGYKPQDLIGQPIIDLLEIITPESTERAMAEMRLVLGGQTISASVYPLIAKDKTIKYGEISGSPILQNGGEIVGMISVIRDITERKQAEEALRKSEEYFRAITENANDVLFIEDAKGTITYCSLSAQRILGYKPQELIGLNALDLIIPQDHARANKDFGKALRTRDVGVQNSFRIRHKNGSTLIMEGIGKNLFHNPVVAGFVMNVRDITERRRVEEALENEKTLLQNMIDAVPDRIYAKDKESRFIVCNKALIRRMGKTRTSEIVGKTDFNLLPLEMAQRFAADEQAVIRSGVSMINREEPLTTEDGKITRWNLATKVPLLDKQGKRIGIVGVGREITDIKQAEEKLLKSEASFQELFNEAPVGYFQYDTQGCITRVNQTELDMLGYSSEEMIGQPVWKFIVEEETSRQQILAKLAGTLRPFKGFEREYRRKDGKIFPFLIQDRIIMDERGNITGIRCAVQDITELKRAEKQLRDTLESLRRAVGTTIQVMVSAVETRDPYTSGHQARSADLARAIAMEMGLPQEEIEGIRIAGSIHDIGKLSIPAEILSKPTKLSDIELSLIKEHARKGFEILRDVESPWPLAEIVYQHHERMDGSGYPRNLKGDDVLIEARILSVADVVEAMASHRPYRPGLGIDAALAEIEKNRGILYDVTVANACLRLFREKGFKLE
jgi:PAS domain S-box-containing protein